MLTPQDQERLAIEAAAVQLAIAPYVEAIDGLTKAQLGSKITQLTQMALRQDLNCNDVMAILGEIRAITRFGGHLKSLARTSNAPKETPSA